MESFSFQLTETAKTQKEIRKREKEHRIEIEITHKSGRIYRSNNLIYNLDFIKRIRQSSGAQTMLRLIKIIR